MIIKVLTRLVIEDDDVRVLEGGHSAYVRRDVLIDGVICCGIAPHLPTAGTAESVRHRVILSHEDSLESILSVRIADQVV